MTSQQICVIVMNTIFFLTCSTLVFAVQTTNHIAILNNHEKSNFFETFTALVVNIPDISSTAANQYSNNFQPPLYRYGIIYCEFRYQLFNMYLKI